MIDEARERLHVYNSSSWIRRYANAKAEQGRREDAVLRKMKEQQKHTCSCSVCGRKRTAIEEELEGLYDAYYQELETFANQPHTHSNKNCMIWRNIYDSDNNLSPRILSALSVLTYLTKGILTLFI